MKKALKILITLCCGITLALLFYQSIDRSPAPIKGVATTVKVKRVYTEPAKTVWLNIFVHGTFGVMLGFLSLNSVLNDDVRDTTYRDANKGMRDDTYFFKTQPLLSRGLHSFIPSFNIASTSQKILAAYPIAKSFDEFLQITPLGNEEQRYYAFGWSGLLSQHRRRTEAIRFFNALQEEISRLKEENIAPKIRIMAHSHGGNLCLNFGAIVPILNTKSFDDLHKYSLDAQTNDSIKKMFTVIKTLPIKEQALEQTDQKRFDYIPTEKKLTVDELVLLGTPLQEETEHFLFSPVFKTVYNVYSGQDAVQQEDWISTKNQKSKQRANNELLARAKKIASPYKPARLIQTKIMYEREIITDPEKAQLVVQTGTINNTSLFDTLLGTRTLSKDPGHKELWALAWAKSQHTNNSPQSYFSPLPTIVMLPLIFPMVAKHSTLNDLDLNFTPTRNSIGIFVMQHGDEVVLDSTLVDASILTNIKKEVAAWEAQEAPAQQDLKMMYQHLTKRKQSHEKPLQEPA